MGFWGLRHRIKKAQASIDAGESLGIVADLISRGAFYDELTDKEKNAFCDYWGTEREALETVHLMVTDSLHFQVKKKPKPTTEAERREILKEVEAMLKEAQEEA